MTRQCVAPRRTYFPTTGVRVHRRAVTPARAPTTQTAARLALVDRGQETPLGHAQAEDGVELGADAEDGREPGVRCAVQPDVPLGQRRRRRRRRERADGPGRHPPGAVRIDRTRTWPSRGFAPRCCPARAPGPGPASAGGRPPRPTPSPPRRRRRGRRRGRSASCAACSGAAPRRRCGRLRRAQSTRRASAAGHRARAGGDWRCRALGGGARFDERQQTLPPRRPTSPRPRCRPTRQARRRAARTLPRTARRRRRARGRCRRWTCHRRQQRLRAMGHGDVGARAHLRPQLGTDAFQLDVQVETLVVEGTVGRRDGPACRPASRCRATAAPGTLRPGSPHCWPGRTRRTSDSLTDVSSSMRSTSGIVSSPWLAVTRSPTRTFRRGFAVSSSS